MRQTTCAERLREAARELWGDQWTLRTLEYADGSEDLVAYRSRGIVKEGVVERERLLFDADDCIVRDRVRLRKREQLESEVIDRDVSS